MDHKTDSFIPDVWSERFLDAFRQTSVLSDLLWRSKVNRPVRLICMMSHRGVMTKVRRDTPIDHSRRIEVRELIGVGGFGPISQRRNATVAAFRANDLTLSQRGKSAEAFPVRMPKVKRSDFDTVGDLLDFLHNHLQMHGMQPCP